MTDNYYCRAFLLLWASISIQWWTADVLSRFEKECNAGSHQFILITRHQDSGGGPNTCIIVIVFIRYPIVSGSCFLDFSCTKILVERSVLLFYLRYADNTISNLYCSSVVSSVISFANFLHPKWACCIGVLMAIYLHCLASLLLFWVWVV